MDFRLDRDLRASCGTMQVCAKLLFVAAWPSGRRGVLVILSEGSTIAAAAADDMEDSTCSLAKCHSAPYALYYSEIQAAVHWHHLFSQYAVVALQETRSILADPLHGILSHSHRPYVCCGASTHGKAGHGLAVYILREVHEQYQVKLRKNFISICYLVAVLYRTG